MIMKKLLLLFLLFPLSLASYSQTYNMSNTSISTCSGTFNDNGGNGNYSNNQNLTMTICPSTPGSRVVINITAFALENNADFLYIYDGNSIGAPTLGVYTGTSGPGLVSATSTNTTGCLTFRFTSNGSGVASGWTGAISCSTPCQTINAVLNSTSPAANGSGIIRICQGQSVTFNGSATFSGSGSGAVYRWDFDDGPLVTGATASHTFNNEGVYVVNLLVNDPTGCVNNNRFNQIVQVSTTPSFAGTGPAAGSICLGQSTTINGVVTPTPFNYDCTPPISGQTFLPDGSGVSYQTSVNVDCFSSGAAVTSATDLQEVCLNMEHSYLGDLALRLTCPNGQSVILKPYPGGGGTYLGGALDNGTTNPGTGANYCFSMGATWPTMLAANTAGTHWTSTGSPANNSMLPGTYQPNQSFANLVGCPLNGTWTITVTDNLAVDNGYIFSWGLTFAPGLLPGNYSFTPTVSSQGWNPSPTITGTSGSTITVTPTTTGSNCYTYSMTDNFNCTYDTTVCVNVIAGPYAGVNNTTTICNGAAPVNLFTLLGSGVTTGGTWTGPSALGSGHLGNFNPATNVAGVYTYTVPASGSCPSDNATVTVAISSLTPTASNTSPICSGTTFNLGAAGGTTYSWSGPGSFTSSAQNPAATAPGTYTVTVTNAAGCSGTATTTAVVNPSPIPTASNSGAYCIGQTIQLNATGGGTYSWSGPSSFNSTTQNPTRPSATTAMAGTYTVTVTSAAGCTTTATTTVTVNPLPTPTASNTGPYCVGQTIQLNSTGGGTYAWSGPGAYSNATQNPTRPSATAAMGGTYTVTVTSAAGCTATATTTVTVNPLPAPTASNTGPYCVGQTIQLNSTGGGTYAWNGPGAYSNATQNPARPSATTAMGGTYTVTVTNPSGCTATATTTVTVNPLPTPTASNTGPYCVGQTIQLNSTGGGTYAWNGPGAYSNATQNAARPSATTAMGGTYTVTVTNPSGCTATATTTVTVNPLPTPTASNTGPYCVGQTIQLNSTGGNTYAWTGPSSFTNATQNPTRPSATTAMSGTYTVTATSAAGCTATATTTVTVNPLPAPTASNTGPYCVGQTIQLNSTGGGTYSWTGPGAYSNATQNPTIAPAAAGNAGTYTVTVTSAAGCTATATATVTVNPLPAPTASNTGPYCVGQTIQLNSTGGGTYSWSGPGAYSNGTQNPARPSATAAMGGTYTVTVTSAAGCTATATATVTINPLPAATISSETDISCFGAVNGSATVSASGGTPGYTYNWAPSGGTNNTAAGLAPGTYTVTVSDANGCTQTTTAIITQPAQLTATVTSTTDATCSGSNGSATVAAGGGTAGYTYSWTPSGGTGSTATGLPAGTYTVTVTDAKGCTRTATANINNLAAPTAGITAFTNVSCFGGTNGTATVTAAGGTGALTYSWAPSGGTGTTASGLGAGIYTVTVTDANGCITTASTTITQPTQLTATISASANVLCFGGSNGSATVTAGGGTPAYTYNWAPSGGTGATISARPAGSYTATVTDANGCTATTSVNITQPPALTATISSITNISCNAGSNGSATVTAGGGSGAYTYNWAPSGGTGNTASGLSAGNYTVTVTDANGCTSTAAALLTQPTQVTATVTALTHATCGNNNGAATVTAGGGTGSYTYNWAPSGGTGNAASGLAPGTYTVTVTDANGCTRTATPTINNLGSPTATITSTTSVSCFGGSNGTATASATGGTMPYTYSWAPAGGTGSSTSGRPAGTYTITVTDANGCTSTASTTITQPALLTTAASVTSNYNGQQVSCFGSTDGSLTATPGGGTPGYTYSWTNGSTSQSPAGVGAGTYTVTATDANGCTATASVTVTQPTAVTSAASVTSDYNGQDVSCSGSTDGAITVTPGGGTPAYTYSWTNGSTTQSPTGAGAGTYTVTITDANGCTSTASVTITQPAAVTSAASVTSDYNGQDVSCNGSTDGSLTVTPGGGTPAYTYSWTNGSTSQSPAGVGAGTYTVTVTDANGCTSAASVTVTQPITLSATISASSDVSCFSGNNGSATVSASNGTPAYSYSWAPSGGNAATANNLTAGTYTVTVTDVNGCSTTASVTITEPALLVTTAAVTSDYNGQDVSCTGSADGSITTTPGGGTPGYTYNWTNGSTSQSPTGVGAGTYTVTVTDANGCTTTASVTVTQPTAVTSAASVTSGYNGQDVSCFASTDGAITVTPGGGTPTYAYSWTNGSTSQSPAGVGAGTYTVTVSDLNGCTSTASVTVAQPTAVTSLASVTSDYNGQDVSCFGYTDGAVTVTPGGGTPAYTYSWTNGSTSQSPTGVGAGTYTVTVTDANGCTSTTTVTVAQPPSFTATASVISGYNGRDVSCFAASDGSITTAPAGGTPAYTYSWTNGSTTQSPAGVSAGTYTVTITDANGCTTSASVTVTEPTAVTSAGSVTSDYNGQDVSCFGSTDGAITVTPGGGTSTYTYSWTNGSTTQSPTGVGAGTYTVTVTDLNGCTSTTSVTVTEPTAVTSMATITSDYNGQDVSCNGSTDGAITVTPGGGTPTYTYSWTNGSNSQSPAGIGAGAYTVTVTDVNGCTSTASVTITQPTAVTSAASVTSGYNGQDVSCFGYTDGAITVTPGGGTPAYTYSWTNGSTAQSPTGVGAGTYTVTVTDVNGCASTASVTVTQPPAFTAAANVTSDYNGQDVSCFASTDGAITTIITGGTPGFIYNWTNGSTVQSPTGIGAGTYSVTVTDVNGCTTSASVTVTEPAAVTSAASVTSGYNGQDVSCNGSTDGAITVTPGGGTPTYTYSWTNGSTSQSPTGISAGTYTVTVTDLNECTSTTSVTVTEPTAVTSVATVTSDYNGQDVSCSGSTDGAITVTPGGGTPAYTYSWTNGSTSQSPASVGAGTYTVTVTDLNGCTSTASVTVTEPTAVTSGASVTSDYNGQDVSCFGSTDGAITVTPGGGTPAYTYSWTNGSTSQSPASVGAGTYTVTVTDVNGCTSTSTVIVTQPPAFTATANVTSNYNGQNVSCFGSTDGAITTAPSGGTPGFSYSWTNSSTVQSPTGVGAGTYTVTITDANGCTTSASVTVTEPAAVTSAASVTSDYNGQDVSCNGSTDGAITVTPGGGTPAYAYSWTNGSTSQSPTGIGAGTYTITVTDLNGCTSTTSVTVTEPAAVTSAASVTSGYNGQDVSCNGSTDGAITVTPGGGTPTYTYSWTNSSTVQSPTGVGAGTYTVTVTDLNGCTSTASVTVTEPAQLTAAITAAANVRCNGGSDGSLTVSGSGGTTAYSYLWTSGGTAATENNLSAGSYTVTITDANGCTASASSVITQPPVLTLDVTSPDSMLCLGDQATLNATPAGGTPAYTYSWSAGLPSAASNTVSPGATITYTVTVKDANNCQAIDSITVVVSPLPSASFTGTNVCDGTAVNFTSTSTISSGSITNTQWNFGDSNNGSGTTTSHLYGGPAAYNVTLTLTSDMNCVSSVTQPVNVYPNAVVNFTADDLAGCQTHCVNFSDLSTVPGSSSVTSWEWEAGGQTIGTSQNPNHCFSIPGSYDITLTVTTNNGCTTTQTLQNYISVYANPEAIFFLSADQLSSAEPLLFVTDASVNASSWLWDFGDGEGSTAQNPAHQYRDTGTYCVELTVTSSQGCTDTEEHCLYIFPEYSFYVPNAFTPNGDKLNDFFTGEGFGIRSFEMHIFDRWGQPLFTTRDMSLGWDGLFENGEKVPLGVYVYKIYIVDHRNLPHEYMGRVDLIR